MFDFLNNAKFRTTVVIVSRILLGCVFVFSGFVKALDPYGFFYKQEEYLHNFGLDFLIPAAFVGAVLLAAVEFLLGICLLLGANIRSTSIFTILFMAFMTPLTLYIALFNPVSDCGCFGDALIISNWATFWKNVVFSFLAVLIFLWRRYSPNLYSHRTEWLIALYCGFFSIALSWYCYQNLPIIDFLPYKKGTDIVKSMEIPEGAPRAKYKTTLLYAKDGVTKEFTMEDYPKDDASWTFVDSKHEIVEKGYEPPIHDFTISNNEIGEITDDVIHDPGYTFLLISSKIEQASTNKRKEINAVYDFASKNGHKFYCLTSSGLESKELKEYIIETEAKYPFMNTDETTLKTMIRSNPGLMLIKKGIVINKWSNKNIPTFNKPLEELKLHLRSNGRTVFYSFIVFVIPLLIILGMDRLVVFVRKRIKKE